MEIDMPRIHITMLGVSGSGKTSFISGLSHSMVKDQVKMNNVLLKLIGLENDGKVHEVTPLKQIKLLEDFQIREVMDGTKEKTSMSQDFNFPGTSVSQVLEFHLRITNKEALNELFVPINLFDYKGGLITGGEVLQKEKNEVYFEDNPEALLSEVRNADVILIVVDSILLVNYASDIDLCKIKTGAEHINMIINYLSTIMSQRGVTIITVLSKTDSTEIPEEYKENGFEKLCSLAKNVLSGIYEYVPFLEKTRGWVFGMIPVTALGEGNSIMSYENGGYRCKIKNVAAIKQKNIDVALLFAIYNALKNRYEKYRQKVEEYERMMQEAKKIGFDRKARKLRAKEVEAEYIEKKNWMDGCKICCQVLGQNFDELFCKEVK